MTSPDPNKRGVRSVFLRVAIVLGRKAKLEPNGSIRVGLWRPFSWKHYVARVASL